MSGLTFETSPSIRFVYPLTLELADDILNAITQFRLLPNRKRSRRSRASGTPYTWCTETYGRGSPLQGYSKETFCAQLRNPLNPFLNFSIFSVLRFSRLGRANSLRITTQGVTQDYIYMRMLGFSHSFQVFWGPPTGLTLIIWGPPAGLR